MCYNEGVNMNFDIDQWNRQPKFKKFVRSALIWIAQIAFVVFLAYLFVNYGMQKVTMSGDSMMNTLEDGNSIIVNKISYRFKDPERFDVVVFQQNGKGHGFNSIKRVIGLPGETVRITDGAVYINDELLEETIVVDPMTSGGLAQNGMTLGENEYFVLGDNRNSSQDSRYASIGPIVKDDIIGYAAFTTNPVKLVSSLNKIPKVKDSASPEATPEATPASQK